MNILPEPGPDATQSTGADDPAGRVILHESWKSRLLYVFATPQMIGASNRIASSPIDLYVDASRSKNGTKRPRSPAF